MIDFCTFGKMMINGKIYLTDLIIYPDGRVMDCWRRNKGREIKIGDLTDLLAARPEIIVAGTGMNGRVKADGILKNELSKKEIEFFALENEEAVRKYNELASRKRTAACFHLTC